MNKKFEFDDDSEYHSNLTLLLGPDGTFDMMHKSYAAQEVMIRGMRKGFWKDKSFGETKKQRTGIYNYD